MRLEKIRLAGFKSFVDPTTIPLPGNLVGVVGPNGCGKSNVIDAVRWVMGESSAKHLRGETMADVIFNGSATRKPVGVASVELVFDNSDGKASGEFATYQQIAIKRMVGRDGQSTYLLNGARCRRKDITDLFLGTGLGARSYAIIEQGTISRLIEAKPDELRGIIEEAAGISRYKERRHETEIRMRHTRENLERLDDLRGELQKQVESLQRQVKKAERYLALKEQEKRAKGALLRIRWGRVQAAQARRRSDLDRYAEALRGCASVAREVQESLDACQSAREVRTAAMQEVQARFYEIGAEIGRLDDYVKQVKRSREETARDLDRLTTERSRAADELDQDRTQLERIRADLDACEQALTRAESAEADADRARKAAEAALAQERAEAASNQNAAVRSRAELDVQHSRIGQLEAQQRQLEARRDRLESESEELQASLQQDEIDRVQQAIEQCEIAASDLGVQLEQSVENIQKDQQRLQIDRQRLHDLRAELHLLQGRLTSLELLQQHAMGKDKVALGGWLKELSLDQAPRLAECLDVTIGWEVAVENVLGLHLEALCVQDVQPYVQHLADITVQDSVALLERRPARTREPDHVTLPRLIDLVQSPLDLTPVLGGVFCAPDLPSAQAACSGLRDHESVVTTKGERLGPGWIAVRQPEDGKAGVLQREREVREVKRDLEDLIRCETQLSEEVIAAEQRVVATELERKNLELELRGIDRQILELRNQLHGLTARNQQAAKRLQQVEAELAEVDMQRVDLAEARAESSELVSALMLTIEHAEAKEEAQQERLLGLQVEFDRAIESFDGLHDERRQIEIRCETLRSSEQLTAGHLHRAELHYSEASERLKSLNTRMGEDQSLEAEQARLETLREERYEVEQQLAESRRQLTELDQTAKRLSESRLTNEHETEGWKDKIARTKIELEGDQVRLENLREQFGELGLDPESEDAETDEESSERARQDEIARVAEDLARLGAVNLMAVEEHAEQRARLELLDEQYHDLSESLATLQHAIEKIDRECRSLFRNTFDRINTGFQGMFPKLFGGGNAYLEMTERDVLETGVSVIARPPGKRNSSIHLLSGGEKALTAVALVFAIFELNPAPFCLLDEVDAPLDDANVGRFCGLVKEMSQRVQFLFITHNKVTMEISQYLAGVTMKEPGVSRIVAVDIAAAVELVTG